jgi:isopenicillin-N epimerase
MEGESMPDGTIEATVAPTLPDWKHAARPISEAGRHFLVRPEIAFLNHASYGARPRHPFDVHQHWQRELEAQPVEFLGRRLPDLLAPARAPLASYMRTSPDNLVFVATTIHGMNIIARSLDL